MVPSGIRLRAALASLSVVGMALGGCATDAETGATSSATQPPSVSSSGDGGLVSRVRVYGSLEELAGDSKLVLVARMSDMPLTVIDSYGDPESAPMAVLQLTAIEPLMGPIRSGGTVRVAVESHWDDGVLRSEKFAQGGTYLVFLTPLGERAPDTYAVTGYRAGMFLQAEDGRFARVDVEGPDSFPATLTLDDVRAVTG